MHRLEPPTSCNSYFQFELARAAGSGVSIEWESDLRIKHVPTQVRRGKGKGR